MKAPVLLGLSLFAAALSSPAVRGAGGAAAEVAASQTSWAFQPPTRHALPEVSDRGWPARTLDYFVLSALERRKLRPVESASRRDWIRRATFDLTGLPPSPEDCDEFDRDNDPGAYARVIDRLLASPRYGERWGRFWLDVARYADDQGNSFLTPTPTAYLYRDWVVNALNRDLPYDEFIRLQVAGDEIPGPADDYVARLAGLGFQGLGPQFRKGAAGEAKAKADELEDRIDTLSRGILGLTVSCARCHDHKFDPIPTRDYYSLAAAYNGAEWPSRMLASPEIVETHRKWTEQVAQQTAGIQKWSEDQARIPGREALARVDAYAIASCRLWVLRQNKIPLDEAAFAKQEGLQILFLNRWIKLFEATGDEPILKPLREAAKQARDAATVAPSDALRNASQSLADLAKTALARLTAVESTPKDASASAPALSPEQDRFLNVLWRDAKAPFFVPEGDRAGFLGDSQRKLLAEKQAQLDRLSKNPPASGPLMPSVRGGGEPMKVLVRGNPEVLGEAAPPGFLRALRESTPRATPDHFGRLELANALASPKNPLTARVLVNRVWHHHFGRGIVATLGNFGKLGSAPTHPELLDTLAVQFMESGWSLKWLHREIMLSATYRLGTAQDTAGMAVDPGNEYLWRMTPRRLDFEAWRDALLSVAGSIDLRLGGPSVDLETPGLKEVAGFNFFTRLNGSEADDPAGRRRTLYTVVSRYTPNITATLFDFPEPNVTSDQRNSTTVPQQQLFVLNSPFMAEISRQFARRLEKSADTNARRIELGWNLAYGRAPAKEELRLALDFLGNPDGSAATPTESGRWDQLCHALLASNELLFLP